MVLLELRIVSPELKWGKIKTERYLNEKVLALTGGNKSQAAELLEISYPSLP